MSIQAINRKAKTIRKAHPSMSWNNAQKAAARSMRSGGGGVSTTHHKKTKRRVSGIGSTAVGTTKKRKTHKKGFLGVTGQTQSRLIQIGEIAVGMAGGLALTHTVLRPIEHKITQHFPHPYVAKAMPFAEIGLGGALFLMGKYKIVRNVGLGIMGAGAGAAVKQLPFHMHSPAESISGMGEFTTLNVPINGTLQDMVAGLIQQDKGYTKTPTVGDSVIENHSGPVRTPTVGAARYAMLTRTATVGDADRDEDEYLFRHNFFRR